MKVSIIGFVVVAALTVCLGPTASANEPAKPCGGIARAEGFEVLAATHRTTCQFARATAKRLRYMVFHEGGLPPRFPLTVRGRRLACRNTHPHRSQLIVCQGHQRKVVMEYGSP